ncbi:SRPBCC domain-containing protein [Bradyrhizobium sp. AUGA SZCCT0182]|uniref:SRPBCC family protein n=1 Tax=Bradyrhizobium sp. AUGA SZCCT0182 TaxID=2807667 RepID=UPI001BA62D6C|nr:SRPBCC domain-containing protein [Bradyrhizobium sp. AUGA SZCCT0182]MBR1231038.1 SRPBCC domain-containing protein [Bradyrhizobium sp. AUGA SZCCT0182]
MTWSLPSVTIVRRIKAPPARVWAAITQPKLMMQWWGPDAGPTLRAEADVRPGGRFSVVFRLLNGEEHNPTGIYQEVIPERKLVFTWDLPGTKARESLVTFLLEPDDGGTRLTLRHEHLPDDEARKSHEQGWSGLLDKLPVFLEVFSGEAE